MGTYGYIRTRSPCNRAADTVAYCSPCAADIMAKALSPFHGGRRKKFPRPDLPRASAPPEQQRLCGWPELGVTRCNDNDKDSRLLTWVV